MATKGYAQEASFFNYPWKRAKLQGVYRTGEANAASKQRTLSRRLENDRHQVNMVYEPLVCWMCLAFRGERVYLALDSSAPWERFVIVHVALILPCQGAALSWVVLSGQSAMVALEKNGVILDRAEQVLPVPCHVILLADRGIVDRELFKKALSLGWGFRIRLKSAAWGRTSA